MTLSAQITYAVLVTENLGGLGLASRLKRD